MNETFKKIEDIAKYVHKQADEHRMPTLIIASPDIQNDGAPLFAPQREWEQTSC